jgi:O-antigen ligase
MFLFSREKTVKLCQSIIDWLLLLLVFWLPLSFAFFHETLNVFTLNKAVILRIFVVIIAWLFIGKIFFAGKFTYFFNRYFFGLFAFLAGSWFVSAFFSPVPTFGFWGNYERQLGFFTLIFFWLFFFLLLFNLESFSRAKRYIAAMFFSSFLACAYGLMQFFGWDLIRWAETGRIFSTLGQPIFFGHWLILIIPFTVYGIVFLTRRFSVRLLLSVLLAFQIFCLLLTYSRSAWLGLAAEIILALLIFLFLKGRKKNAVGLIIITLAGIVFACSMVTFSPRPPQLGYSLKSRVIAAFDFSQGSVKSRFNTWEAAASEFKEESLGRKIFGYGPDSLSEVFARHYQGDWSLDEKINTWPDRAHNIFWDIILTFGLFGLAVYFLIFVYFFQQGRSFFKTAPKDERYWLAIVCILALVGYFCNNLFNFSDIPEYLYFYLILGLLAFLLASGRKEKELKIKLAVISRLLIFIVFLIPAVVFIIYFNLQPLWADHRLMRAAMRINYFCAGALSDASNAIVWGGGNSLFYQGQYLVVGLICFDGLPREDQNGLKNNMLLYLDSLPVEKYFFFAKYQAETMALLSEKLDKNYQAAAERDFAALALKYPQVSSVYEEWANFELKMGHSEEAITVIDKGMVTLPLAVLSNRGYFSHRPEIENQLINYDIILGTAKEQQKDLDGALVFYEKVIAVNPKYPPVYKKIADIYYQKKDLDKAIWYNEKGYSASPKDYSWPLAIGLLYQEKGDSNSALEYFGKVLIINPTNQEARKLVDGLKAQAEQDK